MFLPALMKDVLNTLKVNNQINILGRHTPVLELSVGRVQFVFDFKCTHFEGNKYKLKHF